MIYFMPTAHKHDYDIRDHVGFQLMACMVILSAQAIYRRNQVLIPWILRIYQQHCNTVRLSISVDLVGKCT